MSIESQKSNTFRYTKNINIEVLEDQCIVIYILYNQHVLLISYHLPPSIYCLINFRY